MLDKIFVRDPEKGHKGGGKQAGPDGMTGNGAVAIEFRSNFVGIIQVQIKTDGHGV